MTTEEINQLTEKYFNKEGYQFPEHFEHRYDRTSSAILYSLLRKYKPKQGLVIGTWEGGSICVIMSALIRNGGYFNIIASELLVDKMKNTAINCLEKNGVMPFMIGDITQNIDRIPKYLDFLFIDTDHDLKTTKEIFKNIIPRVKAGSLVAIHDWAVKEDKDKLIGKGAEGVGGWPETDYLMGLWSNKKLPLEKLYWAYEDSHELESSFWIKI